MKYKVGDKVRIKSLKWYKENRDISGDIATGDTFFRDFMLQFCGSVVTIESIELVANLMCYKIKEDGGRYCWVDEMIEGLVEEPTVFNGKEVLLRLANIELPSGTTKIWECPDGHIFKDENGNVIEAKKIVLEKKKPKYPQSYEECGKILGFNPIHSLALQCVVASGYSIEDTQICAFERNLTIRLEYFRKLLICRDAYWKIAGEEMELVKPWEPDWGSDDLKWVIICKTNAIMKTSVYNYNCILAFPTEEMRDAFKENFEPDIEICKELL